MKKIAGLSVLGCAGLMALTACGDLRDRLEGRKDSKEVKIELIGKWESACKTRSILDLIDIGGERQIMDFSAVPGSVEKKLQRFTDGDCKEPAFERIIDASYAVVGDANDGAKNMNLTVHKVEVKPLSEDSANKLNGEKACDISDWKDGEARDVTGKDCLGKKYEEGQVIFDIYKQEGDNLYLGKSSFFLDGDSADQRPESLDLEHPLLKQ